MSQEIVVPRNIEDEVKESYLTYSMSVIISRALPDVRDGLKPSQRRILYAMKLLNLGPQSKHRKCAKISGDTSGDYHPHGEGVIYPTLVRMAQGWIMRYPLVDGQGNFGSVDGDPPAAMRYTEARLTRSSIALMDDLDKDTVDTVPNYDETKTEPVVFPAKFPNLLCNGSSGIAVGMATNIPPHNFGELVAATLLYLEDSNVSIQELMQVMPGPDFPTGGMICGTRGIQEAFHTGRGKLTLRGVIRVEEEADGVHLVIDELPYNVNKARLIEAIAELIHSKTITGISDLRDESDKDGMRVVIELKRNEIPEVIINQLYKFSELETTFGCNMLALYRGLPRVLNVKEMISCWVEHRIEVVRRRTRFELAKAEARAHILEGYLKAIDVLDAIVKLIRSSDSRESAKAALASQFGFTDRQAHAILDLRLYQLTALERDKVKEEHEALLLKIKEYLALLADEGLVRALIKNELQELLKTHHEPRKTQIVPMEADMSMEDLIPKEEVIITLSEDDYIKRMPLANFREQRRGGQGVSAMQFRRDTDTLKGLYRATTHDTLLTFTSFGRCHWLKVWQIPEAGRKALGKPLINLLEDLKPGEKVATVLSIDSFDSEAAIFMATKRGVVKKTALSEFSNPRRRGIWALALDEGDELVSASLVSDQQQIMLFTYDGMAVRFDANAVRTMGRTARGVRGVTLRGENDSVVACEVVNGSEAVLVVCENGYGKRSQVEEFRKTNRGGVGVRSIITSERNGHVIGATSITSSDNLLLMSFSGQTVRIGMGDMRIMGRNTQGVRLVNLKEGDKLVAIQKVTEDKDSEDEESSANPPQEIVEESPAEVLAVESSSAPTE